MKTNKTRVGVSVFISREVLYTWFYPPPHKTFPVLLVLVHIVSGTGQKQELTLIRTLIAYCTGYIVFWN